MTSFAEAEMIPAVRDQLEKLAQWKLSGRLEKYCAPGCAIKVIRSINPTLSEELAQVLFLDLVEAVHARDCSWHWSEVIPDATGADRDGQAADALQVAVDLALDALMPKAGR